MEKIMDNPLSCKNCKKTLDTPVILPCGHTVCKIHEIKALKMKESGQEESGRLVCEACKSEHEIPTGSPGGFVTNTLVKTLLDRRLQAIDMGAEHKAAVRSYRELRQHFNELKRLLTQPPDEEINRVVSEMRNQVDLRREEAKKRVDDEALALIDALDEYETRSCAASRANAGLASVQRVCRDADDLVRSLEPEMLAWAHQLNSYDGSAHRWRAIHQESVCKYAQLVDKSATLKRKLFHDDQFDELAARQYKFCRQVINSPLITLRLKCVNLKETRQFKSDVVVNLGVEWFIKVYVEKSPVDDECVSVYLHASPTTVSPTW